MLYSRRSYTGQFFLHLAKERFIRTYHESNCMFEFYMTYCKTFEMLREKNEQFSLLNFALRNTALSEFSLSFLD